MCSTVVFLGMPHGSTDVHEYVVVVEEEEPNSTDLIEEVLMEAINRNLLKD